MKKSFLSIAFCILSAYSFSQAEVQIQNRKFIDVLSGNLAYIAQYTDVQGTQFLQDAWMHAKIVLNNGTFVNNFTMKFDTYNNKFVANKNDTAYEINPTIPEVILYSSEDTSSNALVFKKGFQINSNVNSGKYLQVLAEGKMILLKFIKKELEEYTEYGNATKLKRFQESYQYFLYDHQKYESINLSKKNLENHLVDKSALVFSYLNEKKLTGKDEKSWIAAVKYYNSL